MRYPDDTQAIRKALREILKIARIGNGKKAGFVSLHTDGDVFWQKVHRAYGQATSESLASVEHLVDVVSGDEETEAAAGIAYRRLAGLLDR